MQVISRKNADLIINNFKENYYNQHTDSNDINKILSHYSILLHKCSRGNEISPVNKYIREFTFLNATFYLSTSINLIRIYFRLLLTHKSIHCLHINLLVQGFFVFFCPLEFACSQSRSDHLHNVPAISSNPLDSLMLCLAIYPPRIFPLRSYP